MSDDEERRAFLESTAGARPLRSDNRAPLRRTPPQPRARRRREADAAVLRDSLRPQWLEGMYGEIWYARPGLSERALRRLRAGEYSVEAELDLHGLSRSAAREALKGFLLECALRNIGCVRVIHGKGHRSGPHGPVLKESVQGWLSQWDDVLGYASAGPRRGGNGAVVVLLRRR